MREAMLFNQLIFLGPISGAASNKTFPVLVCSAFPVVLTFAAKGKGPVNEIGYLGTKSGSCRNCGLAPYGLQIINKEWT
jgi:hypothetical protein